MIRNPKKEMGRVLFGPMPDDFHEEFRGHLKPGDLLQLKESMMLIEPCGPVIVLEADNDKGVYEIMYLRNNYVIGCGRMDIRCRLN